MLTSFLVIKVGRLLVSTKMMARYSPISPMPAMLRPIWASSKSTIVAMPAGQQGTILLVAHNTATSVDVTLGMFSGTQTTALAVGATRLITENINLPAGLPSGNYDIEATITPNNNQAFFNAGFYTVLTNALGNTLGITVS